ncbi:MAG: 1-acyl-sn-glycerol-3-phosphate acyltransferase [Azoarcus sp.]|jgi:1-acyl-sn-glycerol-3-phosphate acyltransferase|nr:1-acyl-sn-glycerol-3-phosphate acyltransferase [Azoarcus sp.]
MTFIRSVLFIALSSLMTIYFSSLGIVGFFLRAKPLTRHRWVTGWVPAMMWAVRHVLGIRYRVLGRENIPSGPAVILSKHQSAWETIGLQQIFPPLCFVLKRELLWIPFLGWGLASIPKIAIDRRGKEAMSQVIEQGRERLKEGLWVALFPEGTRVSPGVRGRYKPGGAILAKRAGVPVVPVAHNAGELWRRNAFLKHPGEIIVSIGPAIEVKGIKAEEINRRARDWIENEMSRLFPHHFQESEAVRAGDGRAERPEEETGGM